MSYTPAEVSQAVEQIVRPKIRFDHDALGTRKVGTTFGDLKDAASGVFLSRDGSPFYVVSLARDRLVDSTTTLRNNITEFLRYATAVGRRVTPVTRVRTLNNAKAALDALATATGQRAGAFDSITEVPAFKRFKTNTGKFLKEESKKINYRGDIIEAPEQARELLRPAAVALREEYDDLLRRVELLRTAIPNYEALNLPATLSQVILDNASAVLDTRIEELEALTPEQRLTILREVTLDILAAQTAVEGFGSIEAPTTFLQLEGLGGLYADETHPAVAAALYDIPGGYSIYELRQNLRFEVDETFTINYPVPGSFVARLDFLGSWPRRTIDATNEFTVQRDDEFGTFQDLVTLVANTDYEAWEFQAEVNTQLTLTQFECILDFSAPRTTDEFDIVFTGGLSHDFTGPVGVDYGALGVVAGDFIVIRDKSSGGYRDVYSVTSEALNVVTADLLFGAGAGGENEVLCVIGREDSSYPAIRLWDEPLALGLTRRLKLEDTPAGANTLAHLGVVTGTTATSARTPATTVRDDLSINAATYVGLASRLGASTEFVLGSYPANALTRSHPEDPQAVSLYLYRGRAEIVTDGINAQFRLLDEIPDTLEITGQALVVRETTEIGDVDNYGPITNIAGDLIDVTMVAPVDIPMVGPNVVIVELGWNLSTIGTFKANFEVRVDEDGVQDGQYIVQDMSRSSVDGEYLPFQFLLDRSIPSYIDAGNQPVFFTSSLGRDATVFVSKSTLLDTKVVSLDSVGVPGDPTYIENPAQDRFFDPGNKEAVGTTQWVYLPEVPKRLEVGDILELYLTSPVTPTLVSVIDQVESENLLVHIEDAVATDLISSVTAGPDENVQFTTTGQVPFARIRKAVKQNFDDMSELLEVWQTSPVNDTLNFFRQLDADLNGILVNKNPTVAQVGTLKNRLNTLDSAVVQLQDILAIYSSDIVTEIDVLMASFTQKGADRAVEVLFEADFQTFFGMDQDESSYAGNLQKQIRDIQKMDLPVRRDNQEGFESEYDATAAATIKDVDFEYTPEDYDPIGEVDIPELNDVLPDFPAP